MLRDVASCDYCGKKMSTGSATSRKGIVYYYYICNNKECEYFLTNDTMNRVDPNLADSAAYEAIQRVVSSEEIVTELTSMLNGRLTEAQPMLAGEMKRLTQTLREERKEFVELSAHAGA